MVSAGALIAQVPQKMLIEEATQAGCGPCAAQNPAFDALLMQNRDKVSIIKYQVWWPGVDIMHNQNPTDVRTRVGELGSNAAPNFYLNGGGFESLSAMTQARIDGFAGAMSPVSIEIGFENDGDSEQVKITINVKNETSQAIAANSLKLYTALNENQIHFPSAPGTNGETEFNWVMRKMYPSGAGMSISEAIMPGESYEMTFTESYPSYIYNLNALNVVAFVQDGSGTVVQSEESGTVMATGALPNLAMSYSIDGYDGYCTETVDLVAKVENTGQLEIESFDIVQLGPNGARTPVYSSTEALPAGEETLVTFSDIMLNFGASVFAIDLDNIKYASTKRLANLHPTEANNDPLYVVNTDPFATSIQQGFDITNLRDVMPNTFYDNPEGVRLFTVDQRIFRDVTWPLGGFGNSDGCIRYDFVAWTAGQEASLVFDKLDLSGTYNAELSYAYGYAARGGFATDRFIVEASADCGETWTELVNKRGTELITGADPGATIRFYPKADEWAEEKVSMSDFDGEGEVILRFRGISGGAQAMYVDDIMVSGTPVSSNDVRVISKVQTYPNPAQDVVKIDFDLDEATDLQVVIQDLSGKVVEKLASASFGIGTHSLQWYPEVQGTFLVTFINTRGVQTEKVTVVK